MMKLFSKPKPRTWMEVFQQTRQLLLYFHSSASNLDADAPKTREKTALLCKVLRELKSILYGSIEVEPIQDVCVKLTNEFFREDTFRILVLCLPKLNLEACKDATLVVVNLQVNYRLIASKYLESNIDIIDIFVTGYENPSIALHYGGMLRGCICHQSVTKYVLERHLRMFFGYLQLPNFEVSSDASATFKELLTRHKDTVANFLTKNYDWFFEEFNTKLLRSPDYVTRRQAVKLLDEVLLNPSNTSAKVHYLSSVKNLILFMDLFKDSYACSSSFVLVKKLSKIIQIDAFHVFKLFVVNPLKPHGIVSTLINNSSRLLHLIENFSLDKENPQFEKDKSDVLREIASLELNPKIRRCTDSKSI